MRKTAVYIINALLFFSLSSSARGVNIFQSLFPSKTVYFGINVGGGSTEWQYLVDTTDPSDTAVTTPTKVTEGGPSWGVVFGYDVSKNFAIELQYMQFADARIHFSEDSPYPVTRMISRTDAYSLSGKFLAQVANTHVRAFAAVGPGLVERQDVIYSDSCITPYVSSGLVYNFVRHWMLETGFQYYTGFGRSELDPVNHYIPFAWDGYVRLAYQM